MLEIFKGGTSARHISGAQVCNKQLQADMPCLNVLEGCSRHGYGPLEGSTKEREREREVKAGRAGRTKEHTA